MQSFNLKLPKLEFGAGKIKILPNIIKKYGNSVLLVTGERSLQDSGLLSSITSEIEKQGISLYHATVSGEPTPELIDSVVSDYKNKNLSCVCSIGGGSAIDTGKAVAAMLKEEVSVINFLEGVGDKNPSGKTLPFIAVPTTAGTCSEATKNAVISRVKKNGFKKSLRHDNYVPEVAIIDPVLTLSCSRSVSAASGLDALSQIMEGYVSTKATPFTDALAIDAVGKILKALPLVCTTRPEDINLREDLSYAAFISGIALAHAGLATPHGLASEIGAIVNAPHGLICGNLIAPWVEKTINKLLVANNQEGLNKFLNIARIICGETEKNKETLLNKFIKELYLLAKTLELPSLKKYEFTENELKHIAEVSGDKNNPVAFTTEERLQILKITLK